MSTYGENHDTSEEATPAYGTPTGRGYPLTALTRHVTEATWKIRVTIMTLAEKGDSFMTVEKILFFL